MQLKKIPRFVLRDGVVNQHGWGGVRVAPCKMARVHAGDLFKSNCTEWKGQHVPSVPLCLFRTYIRICQAIFFDAVHKNRKTVLEKGFCEISSGSLYHYKMQSWSLHFSFLSYWNSRCTWIKNWEYECNKWWIIHQDQSEETKDDTIKRRHRSNNEKLICFKYIQVSHLAFPMKSVYSAEWLTDEGVTELLTLFIRKGPT